MGRLVSFPVIILYGVCPDVPLTYRLRMVAAHSSSQANAGCSDVILFLILFSAASFSVLSCPCTRLIAFSTAPFD